jgi:hypothetical protein
MDFEKLQSDVAMLCRAWDAGKLSKAEVRQLRFARDLIHQPDPSGEDFITAVAIIGILVKDHPGPSN